MPTYAMLTRRPSEALARPESVVDLNRQDVDTATRVALLVRSFGHATTETWVVTPWERFMDLATGLKS